MGCIYVHILHTKVVFLSGYLGVRAQKNPGFPGFGGGLLSKFEGQVPGFDQVLCLFSDNGPELGPKFSDYFGVPGGWGAVVGLKFLG